MGASPLSGSARVGVASGVVLLGDASGFADPVTGGGMSQALMTAELLAEYIFANKSSGDEWLWSFENRRRRMLWDYRFLTKAVLQLSRKPQFTRAVLSVLRGWPGLLSHGIGVAGGTKRLLGCAVT
jgi:flavin-dependent dehydrogenase